MPRSTHPLHFFAIIKNVVRYSFPLLLFFLPGLALAQNPSVDSFTVSPPSLNSGAPAYFIWDLSDAGGYSFMLFCSAGVVYKKSDGSTIACESPITSTIKTDDSLTVYVSNFSGGTKTVRAKIIPKKADGTDYTAAAMETSVSVATDHEPITSFTGDVIKTESGKAVTISWSTKSGITGVNLKIECRDEIKVSSPSYTLSSFMPCGKPIFSTDLSANSSLTLNFSNSSLSTISYTLTLLPAFAEGMYDGTHAKTLTLDVVSDVPPAPSVKSFTASSTIIYSGEEVKVSWEIQDAKGANIQLSCVSGVSATSSKDPSLILPCGKPAFNEDLAASGSLTLSFHLKESSRRQVGVLLLPAKKTGEYDATLGKNITLNIDPPPPPSLPPQTSPVVSPPSKTSPSPSPSTIVKPMPAATQPPPSAELKTAIPKEKAQNTEEAARPTPSSQESPLNLPSSLLEDAKLTQEEKESLLLITGRVEQALSRKLLLEDVIDIVERATPAGINPETHEFDTYEITGKKKVKLFFFIPIKMRLRVEITKNGEILNIRKPWWNFLISY